MPKPLNLRPPQASKIDVYSATHSLSRTRRKFIRDLVAAGCVAQFSSVVEAFASGDDSTNSELRTPIVDTHIHLFDPTRVGGVPWPLPEDKILFRPALPDRYRRLVASENVVAAIAIECSPLATDNDWLLKTVRANPLIVGAIGDLDPALENFPAQLQRLHADPLFLGIRYGNLWDRDLGAHLSKPLFIDNLKMFAQAGLLFESANPNPTLISDLLRLSELVPDLRILIDHLPHAQAPLDPSILTGYLDHLRELSQRRDVFIKGSEIVQQVDGKASLRLDTYRPWLDTLWSLFGEDRIVFGSDWPNSDTTSPLSDVFNVAREYVATKGADAKQKFFSKNSATIYRWKPRNEAQRKLSAL